PAWIPVMAVGDDQRIELEALVAAGRDFPDTVLAAMCVLERSLEADVRIQLAVLCVTVKVAMDVGMTRISRDVLRHPVVAVLHDPRVGVDVQRVVGCARARGLVLDAPEPAEVARLLEARDRNAALLERLHDRQAARSGADYADFR